MATGERNLLELLGATLNFPGYYRPNWDAFDDCVGDMMREDAFPTAVLLSNADEFLRARPQDFVRAIHLLYTASEAVELNHGIFRLEFVLFGSWTL